MQHNHFSRKKRQLNNLNQKFKRLVNASSTVDNTTINQLALKIKKLVGELKSHISISFLKKSLGATAFAFLFGNNLSAQTFTGPTQNPFGLTASYYFAIPTAVDVDNDGDLDLVVAEYYGNIKYYQNTGTASSPAFTAPVLNPFGIQQGYYYNFPTLCDLDNDGDFDLLTGGYYGVLYYSENTGTASAPQFATAVANPFGLTSAYYIGFPKFVDLDNDGDFDLMVGEYGGNMGYYQNIGTSSAPNFATKQLNPFGLTASYEYAIPSLADIDNDGDFDLLVGEYYGNLNYFENIGTATVPNFASVQQNPFGINPGYGIAMPCFADMDNDGDQDLFVGETYGNFQYYENTTLVDIATNEFEFDITVFPNPTIDFITIKTIEKIEICSLFDITGKEIPIAFINDKISLQDLAPGFYTLKVMNSKNEMAVTGIQKL